MDEMHGSVRKVVARYLGQNSEDDGLPWLEHLEETQEAVPGLSGMVRALGDAIPDKAYGGELKDHNKAQDVGKSLQDDIIDPHSMAREQDTPAVRSDVEDLESGSVPITHFMDPEMYGEGSSLKYWWDSRERDEENSGNAFGQQTPGFPLEAGTSIIPTVLVPAGRLLEEMPGHYAKTAVSLDAIIARNKHPKAEATRSRGSEFQPTLVSTEDELRQGIMHFKMTSLSERKDEVKKVRQVVIQFLKNPGGGEVSSDLLSHHNCLIGCTCPAFLYWGPQYYALTGGYMFKDMKTEVIGAPDGGKEGVEVAPKPYYKKEKPGDPTPPLGRGEFNTFCKHIYACYIAIRTLKAEVDPEALLEEGVTVKDNIIPATDLEDTDLVFSDYGDFKSMIYHGGISEELLNHIEKLHQDQGASLPELQGFLRKWNSWMGSQKSGDIRNILTAMDHWKTSPSILQYALLTSVPVVRRNNLLIPDQVMRKAFRITQNWRRAHI